MILNNVKAAFTDDLLNIRVTGAKISRVQSIPFDDSGDLTLELNNALVFPGLINSHDHLDFNLFSALGDKKYQNYTEWGPYIQKTYKDRINSVLKVPPALREQWGIYKNLLCGVTTVVNHGKKVKKATDLITIYEDAQSIHSVRFEKKWKLALNNPLKKNIPAVIHTGEGTDQAATAEIDKLIGWNKLKRPLIGVHGIAMTGIQASAFRALVWCPASNEFMFGQTARVDRLNKHIPILFGTDSTLTSDWNIWQHIQMARKTGYLSDQELFDSLTTNAAQVWDLNCGEIAEGKNADIVVAKTGKDFFKLGPENILLVLIKGAVSLFDEEIYPQLKGLSLDGYSRIYINGTCKYVKGNLPAVINKIKQYYPEAGFPVI